MTPTPQTHGDSSERGGIKNLDFVEEYVCLEEIGSTNSFAKELKSFPSVGLTVIRALRQSGGRGSRERTYFSDHGGGLWVSVVTPVKNISEHFVYNRAVSLAICETLKSIGPPGEKTAIKWPNDVYCSDRKIAGILLENVCGNPNVIIVGFGLNVNIASADFPPDLRQSATSVLIENGEPLQLEPLLERILTAYWEFCSNGDQQRVHERYVDNLYKKGREASVDSHCGRFLTVEADGQLRMRTAQGDLLHSRGSLRFMES